MFESQIESQQAEWGSAFFHGNGWEEAKKHILESLDVLIYPKMIMPVDEDLAIFNSDSMTVVIS